MKKELIPLVIILFSTWFLIVFLLVNMVIKHDYFNFYRNIIIILNIIQLLYVIGLIELEKKP